MKTLLLTFFAFAVLSANAQDCSKYYVFQTNKIITIGVYDRKGEDNGKIVYTVTNAAGDSAVLNSETFSSKGKSMGKSISTVKCNNGMFMIDMKLMMPPQQPQQGPMKDANATATATSSFLEYPATMNTGDKLKDGSFNITADNGGPKSSMNFDIYDRKVAGKESVTVPAGTYDCYKITYTSKVKIKSGPFSLPSFSVDIKEWFVPGFGIVKTENKSGSTALVSIQ